MTQPAAVYPSTVSLIELHLVVDHVVLSDRACETFARLDRRVKDFAELAVPTVLLHELAARDFGLHLRGSNVHYVVCVIFVFDV